LYPGFVREGSRAAGYGNTRCSVHVLTLNPSIVHCTLSAMSFLSLFRSKPKSKARTAAASTPTGASSSLLPNDSVIIVNIPSSSLLADDISRRIGDQRSPSSQSVSSSLWDRVSEGGKEEADTDESRMEMEEADTRKLGRAILGVGEITELMEECGGVVRERGEFPCPHFRRKIARSHVVMAGSTTLGIFRPYRTAESPLEIRKLSLLFLAYAQDFQTKDVAPLPDIWGSKDTKAAKLARFRRELKYAVIHDVIGVLKWVSPSLLWPSYALTSPLLFRDSDIFATLRPSLVPTLPSTGIRPSSPAPAPSSTHTTHSPSSSSLPSPHPPAPSSSKLSNSSRPSPPKPSSTQ
jgi:hypothetical protein